MLRFEGPSIILTGFFIGSNPRNGLIFHHVIPFFLGMIKPGDNIPITEREKMIEKVVKPNRKTYRVRYPKNFIQRHMNVRLIGCF